MISKNAPIPKFGRFEFEDGSIYEGCFIVKNKTKIRSGQGTLSFCSNSAIETKFEKYSGQWHEDQMEGFGVYEYISGAKYTGNWRQNQHNGPGKYEFPDGAIYEGEWADHLMHGAGTFTSASKLSWSGEFREGNFSSKMQNDLKAQKRIEVKKKLVRGEIMSFLRQLEIDILGDKKGLKTILPNLFAKQIEEEVGIKRSNRTSRWPRFRNSKISNSTNGLGFSKISGPAMPQSIFWDLPKKPLL